VKVELHRPDEPDAVVATVAWTDGTPVIDTQDDILRATLQKVFAERRSWSTTRRTGAWHGAVHPAGDLEWFRRGADASPPAGSVRFVPGSPRAASTPRQATGRSRRR
jgi:hypothetical protein